MGQVIILPETVKDPISLIGRRAGICYHADISDPKANYQRGLDCIKSGHGRTLEFVDVHMVLKGYSAKVIREWYTHIGGAPTRLQESTRYVEYTNFKYIIPPEIEKIPDAKAVYESTMNKISEAMEYLESVYKIKREDSSMLCPLGMRTTEVDKRNVRNLIDMSRNRECSRAFWEYKNDLFPDVKRKLSEYSTEWNTLVDLTFYPKCEMLGYCPEKKSCGRKSKYRLEVGVDLSHLEGDTDEQKNSEET